MIIIIILITITILYLFLFVKEHFIINNDLEITLYDNTTTNNLGGYNIGDLLNMPSYWAGWARNPHNDHNIYQSYLEAINQFPNSILYYYSLQRTDNNEPIPNMIKIESATDLYIENNNKNVNNDNNILYVHLRSGDKGVVEDLFINKINELTNNYDKIIILTGIHSDERFEKIDNSKRNLIESLKKINNDKIDINLDNPDNHLVIMRKCKNLLLHKGGFSILGSIIFTGTNLYFTDLFECRHNQEIINNLKNRNITPILL